MGRDSSIQWCDDTLNVWHGCTKVSEGCKHCYAEVSTPVRVKRAGREAIEAREATEDEPAVAARAAVAPLELWGPNAARSETKNWESNLRSYARAAVKSGQRRRVFAQSLSDTFEDRRDLDPLRARFFDAIERLAWRAGSNLADDAASPLDLLLLTKRPEHVRAMVPPAWLLSWPSYVWIGCTVESQAMADERIPHLLRVPAAVRFLSVEPQIEAVDLHLRERAALDRGEWGSIAHVRGLNMIKNHDGIRWVIQGGESGTKARPFDLAWARSMRDQCRAAGAAYFFKQAGARPVVDGYDRQADDYHHVLEAIRDSHGGDESEWPRDLQGCRAFPLTK